MHIILITLIRRTSYKWTKILSLSFLHVYRMVDHHHECRLKYNLILSHMTYAQITTKTMMSTLVLFLGLFASICIHGSVLCMGGNSIALTNKQNFIIILCNQLVGKIRPIFHPFVFKFNSPEVALKFHLDAIKIRHIFNMSWFIFRPNTFTIIRWIWCDMNIWEIQQIHNIDTTWYLPD